jgi:hypothetical protein
MLGANLGKYTYPVIREPVAISNEGTFYGRIVP